MQFNAGAPTYTFNIGRSLIERTTLNITETGIVNNSGFAPEFLVQSASRPIQSD
jgi:hypothetical protein